MGCLGGLMLYDYWLKAFMGRAHLLGTFILQLAKLTLTSLSHMFPPNVGCLV